MFILKLKPILWIIIVVFFVFCCGIIYFQAVKPASNYNVPNSKYCVVIDAGHGGIDGGSVGKLTNVKESELNLIYAKNLANKLSNMGITSVLTRTDSNGLYDSNAKSLKKSDMKKRKEIIENTNPTLVISIHMNSFTLSSAHGSQAFYKSGNESGKKLAQSIQDQFNNCLETKGKQASIGDYYMVNCTDLPASLVECGYLSNEKEEKLLQTLNYQNKLCFCIASGIVNFINSNNN